MREESAVPALFARSPRAVALRLETTAARLVDVEYPASTEFETHRHDEDYLCLLVEGAYREWPGAGGGRCLSQGQDLIYGEGSRHAVRIGSGGCRILHVSDDSGDLTRRGPDPLRLGILWQIAHALVTDGATWDADRVHLEALVHELGSPPHASRREPWVDRVRERLREEHGGSRSLAGLAQTEGLHPAHLARAFRAAVGLTVGEYLRRLRVAAAVRLLRETDEPLAAVALLAGFADQSHLGRWLRRYTGRTPGEVRRGVGPAG